MVKSRSKRIYEVLMSVLVIKNSCQYLLRKCIVFLRLSIHTNETTKDIT
jgi:hypothetical protein